MTTERDLEIAVEGLHLADDITEEQNIDQVLETTIQDLDADDDSKGRGIRQQSIRWDLSKADPYV